MVAARKAGQGADNFSTGLEQFLKIGSYKSKFAVKEKREWSCRTVGKLTEDLLKVHVSTQGQEAPPHENMTLREVIKLLREQQSATA